MPVGRWQLMLISVMKQLTSGFAQLSRARQLVLASSAVAIFFVFAPWHAIGVDPIAYSGLQDQNFIVGLLVLLFHAIALLVTALPALGMRLPRLPWRMGSLITFLGGQSTLLLFVLLVMHTTTLTRAAHYDLRLGIQIALVASALVFLGGHLIRVQERTAGIGQAVDPLTQVPRAAHRHAAEAPKGALRDSEPQSDQPTQPARPHRDPSTEDDRRMRLDI